MKNLSGIGKLDRERLGSLLRGAHDTISVREAAKILNLSQQNAAQQLARWAVKGWVSRIKQGVYIPVPLESQTPDIPLEDPWVVAQKLYQPCYIGGWSAAEYWGFTEQIFRTIIVKTTAKPRNRNLFINGTRFLLYTISPKTMFGLTPIWREQIKVSISDPTRTIIDLLSDSKLGGGIRPTADMLQEYLNSEHKNGALLLDYAERLHNGAVFKRLGFLLERYAPLENDVIEACKKHLTKGKVKLDPQLSTDKLITKWQLWIPKDWKE